MKLSQDEIKFISEQFYIGIEEAQKHLSKHGGDIRKTAYSMVFEWPVNLHRQ